MGGGLVWAKIRIFGKRSANLGHICNVWVYIQYRKLVFLYLFFWYFFVREFISQSSATVFLMVCQLPTVRYSPRYRIHWIYEFICACNLIMRDSWIDEVHMSASWLCSLFLSHLLGLCSSDRSHNHARELRDAPLWSQRTKQKTSTFTITTAFL